MKRRAVFITFVLAIALVGLALRLPQLDLRPMHGDEAVHAVKFNDLWQTGGYQYDPQEFHGPTLYYFTLPSVWLSGVRDFCQTEAHTYRIVPVVFGTGLILLLLLVADGLGRWTTVCAAALTALSPAMLFYSRYYIQETLLVFFTFLAIAAGWRYVQSRHLGWALLAGAGLGLMHATKETSLIAFGALGGALAILVFAARQATRSHREPSPRQASGQGEGEDRRNATLAQPIPEREGRYVRAPNTTWSGVGVPARHTRAQRPAPLVLIGALRRSDAVARGRRPHLKSWALGGALLAAIVVSILLLSGFFTNLHGPLDSLRAYATYCERASGGAHEHPWYYYLNLLTYTRYGQGPIWSEGLIVALALLGVVAAGVRGTAARTVSPLLRFLALYTILSAAIYSAVPYKTPWCMLGFLHGMILLAGVGAVALVRVVRYSIARVAVVAMLVAGGIHLGWQAQRANDAKYCANEYSPYVYAHTLHDVAGLARQLEQLAAVVPDGRGLLIKVMVENCWPLPWYLRGFARVGYWETVPDAPDADVILASSKLQGDLERRLQGAYEIRNHGLRRDERLLLYIRQGLWDAFIRHMQNTETAETQSARE